MNFKLWCGKISESIMMLFVRGQRAWWRATTGLNNERRAHELSMAKGYYHSAAFSYALLLLGCLIVVISRRIIID